MAVSKKTAQEIVRTIDSFCNGFADPVTSRVVRVAIGSLLHDLSKIEGSKSYKQTMNTLVNLVNNENVDG